jgi:hypothetical protein
MAKKPKSPEVASPAATNEMDDYEVKNHLETLMKAEEIKADSGKMEKVRKLAGRHRDVLAGIGGGEGDKIKSIDDIRKYKQKKFGAKA